MRSVCGRAAYSSATRRSRARAFIAWPCTSASNTPRTSRGRDRGGPGDRAAARGAGAPASGACLAAAGRAAAPVSAHGGYATARVSSRCLHPGRVRPILARRNLGRVRLHGAALDQQRARDDAQERPGAVIDLHVEWPCSGRVERDPMGSHRSGERDFMRRLAHEVRNEKRGPTGLRGW